MYSTARIKPWMMNSYQFASNFGGYAVGMEFTDVEKHNANLTSRKNLRADGRVNVIEGVGSFAITAGPLSRVLQRFAVKSNHGDMEVYCISYHPGAGGSGNFDHTGYRLHVTKYELGDVVNGIQRMKMTQRYIGAYSLDAANFKITSAISAAMFTAAMQRIMSLGDSYWDDALRSKDDIVRYFPLLGYVNRSNNARELLNVRGATWTPYLNRDGITYNSAAKTGALGTMRFDRDILMISIDDNERTFYKEHKKLPMRLYRSNLLMERPN